MGLFSSTRQPHKRCALRWTAAGRQRVGSGGEWSGGQGRVPDCLGGLSRVGISSRSTRPWNGQPPSVTNTSSHVHYMFNCYNLTIITCYKHTTIAFYKHTTITCYRHMAFTCHKHTTVTCYKHTTNCYLLQANCCYNLKTHSHLYVTHTSHYM